MASALRDQRQQKDRGPCNCGRFGDDVSVVGGRSRIVGFHLIIYDQALHREKPRLVGEIGLDTLVETKAVPAENSIV